MSELIQGLMACMIVGFFFLCIISTLIVLASCVLSGRISHGETNNIGAPEGGIIPFHPVRLNAEGSNLVVLANYKSSSSNAG